MEKRIYIDQEWRFSEVFQQEMTQIDYDDSKMEKIRIPHTCKEIPFHYFDEHIYQMISGYRRILAAPKEWEGKKVLLTFDGVAHECEVYINGNKAGVHHCGYTAFTIDISSYLKYGEDNILAVKVDSRENLNVPPFGYVIDYMTYGGIYRDVYLEVKNPVYIEDAFLHAQIERFEKEKSKAVLTTEVMLNQCAEDLTIRQYLQRKESFGSDRNLAKSLKNDKAENAGENKDISIKYAGKNKCCKEDNLEVIGTNHKDASRKSCILGEVEVDNQKKIILKYPVKDITLWDVENPALYEVKTQILHNEEVLDEKIVTFGFRKTEFKNDGFYLNEKKVKIRGLNRHQSYPYVGYAMPKSMQIMDADILKKELGLNAVRTSHYPQSHYFLDHCDEIGLLVFTEMPGWQHIGNEEWKAQAVENVKEMVIQYRNHPSIILWGVRINESKDDDEFYSRTNAMARELDPYRQTGGVRALKKGNLLEDVYTYNDFSHDGKVPGCEPKKNITSNMDKPYLVSEYNGHMYPTKAFDWEEHRVEHALRHANVLNAIAGSEDITGSFGWCMADYNTHKDFGSGDRICYHGVLDMFRNPKLAANIYSCLQEENPVLSLSSTMDIGEHPACNRGKTWIFSNMDSVRMYKNDRFIKEYHSKDSGYRNLAHGPIVIDDFIGNAIEENENFTKKQAAEIKEALNYVALHGLSNLPKRIIFIALKMMAVYHMKPGQAVELYNKYIGDWGGTSTVYRFEGIKYGKVVKTIVKEPMKNMHLSVKADHTTLLEDQTYDVAAIRIQMLDDNENQLYFYNEPVLIQAEGPIEIIGGEVISLKGGMGGTYIKTTGKAGKAALILKTAQAEAVRIEFMVEKQD